MRSTRQTRTGLSAPESSKFPQPMSANPLLCRLWFLCCLTLAATLTLTPDNASGQPLDMAPIQVFSHGRLDPDHDFGQIVIGTQRDMPVYNLLPQVTADSYFELLRIVAGVQIDDTRNKERLRYRATAIETVIQKSPWASRFVFLDYDATGMEDLDANWLSLSVGPGLHAGTETMQIIVRGQAFGSFNTFRFGDIVFSELGREAADSKTGIGYGLAGHASLVVVNLLELRGEYERSWLTADDSLQRDELAVRLEVVAGGGWRLFGLANSMRGELGEFSMRRTAFGAGVSYTAGDTTY